jgi:hypothetical protein
MGDGGEMARRSIYQDPELDRRRRELCVAIARWNEIRPSWYLEPTSAGERREIPEELLLAERDMAIAETAYFGLLYEIKRERSVPS